MATVATMQSVYVRTSKEQGSFLYKIRCNKSCKGTVSKPHSDASCVGAIYDLFGIGIVRLREGRLRAGLVRLVHASPAERLIWQASMHCTLLAEVRMEGRLGIKGFGPEEGSEEACLNQARSLLKQRCTIVRIFSEEEKGKSGILYWCVVE